MLCAFWAVLALASGVPEEPSIESPIIFTYDCHLSQTSWKGQGNPTFELVLGFSASVATGCTLILTFEVSMQLRVPLSSMQP